MALTPEQQEKYRLALENERLQVEIAYLRRLIEEHHQLLDSLEKRIVLLELDAGHYDDVIGEEIERMYNLATPYAPRVGFSLS